MSLRSRWIAWSSPAMTRAGFPHAEKTSLRTRRAHPSRLADVDRPRLRTLAEARRRSRRRHPGLARERAEQEAKRAREQAARDAEDAELAAFIEYQRRFTAAIEEEMKEVNAAMARRRRWLAEEEAKY